MKIETLSTFPEMFESVMGTSMMRIAQEKELLTFKAHNLRDWTYDKHHTTDDSPYGGGQGLVMKPEPFFNAYDDIVAASKTEEPPYTIFLSPTGERFSNILAQELSEKESLLFICGHYEGIDERAYTLADRCLSLGDYVVTSGELASLVIIDAVVRKIGGVLGDENSALDESFEESLLEYPHYTRPASFRGMDVPAVLLSGNHAAIKRWRREQSLERTKRLRPDLIKKATLLPEDLEFLQTLSN